MAERTKLLFQDGATNTYTEDQVVLEEKDGRKSFHTGSGGTEVLPVGSGLDVEDVWQTINDDRKAAKEDKAAKSGERKTEPK